MFAVIPTINNKLVYYLLTPQYRVLPEQLTALQLVRNSPHFTEPQGSLPHSQASATCLYPGPAQSSPYTHIPPPTDLYCSPNIVRVIKWRRMRWAGHVARMGEERGRIGSWWGNRRERDQWGDLGVDGWIILGWICRRWDVGIWTGLGWSRIETSGGRL